MGFLFGSYNYQDDLLLSKGADNADNLYRVSLVDFIYNLPLENCEKMFGISSAVLKNTYTAAELPLINYRDISSGNTRTTIDVGPTSIEKLKSALKANSEAIKSIVSKESTLELEEGEKEDLKKIPHYVTEKMCKEIFNTTKQYLGEICRNNGLLYAYQNENNHEPLGPGGQGIIDTKKIEVSLKKIKEAADNGSQLAIDFLSCFGKIPNYLEVEKNYLALQKDVIPYLKAENLKPMKALKSIAESNLDEKSLERILAFFLKCYCRQGNKSLATYISKIERREAYINKYLLDEDSFSFDMLNVMTAGVIPGISLGYGMFRTCPSNQCKDQYFTSGLVLAGSLAVNRFGEKLYKLYTTYVRKEHTRSESKTYTKAAKILSIAFAINSPGQINNSVFDKILSWIKREDTNNYKNCKNKIKKAKKEARKTIKSIDEIILLEAVELENTENHIVISIQSTPK